MDERSAVVWFTKARKIPRLVGKLPSGEHIWGGPYQLSQFVAFAIVLVAGVVTMPLWGQWGIFNWVILVGVSAAIGYVMRWLPATNVNPLELGSKSAGLIVARPQYRRGGRPLAPPRPVRVSVGPRLRSAPVMVFAHSDTPESSGHPVPTTATTAAPVPPVAQLYADRLRGKA